MSRRICITILFASFALAAPTASLAQSSSQAQYQGVAPETQTPVTGTGNNGTPGGSAGGNTTGGTTNGTKASGGGTSGASGNGGAASPAPAGAGQSSQSVPAPQASSDTSPFSGGDFVWIVLACAGLAGLGFVLRRMTRNEPAGV